MASFTITPLTDHTAAEVVGLDFTQPVDANIRSTLSRAFADHHVLVMRDQHFAPEQFVAAAQIFGELLPHDKKERHVPGHPEVEYISNEEIVNGKRIIPGGIPHRPLKPSARRRPSRCSRSNCRPAAATRNTSICIWPMTTCPRTPSENRRAKGGPRLSQQVQPAPARQDHRRKSPQTLPPPGVHPLVRTHPENGRKALYLDPVVSNPSSAWKTRMRWRWSRT